MLNESAQHGTVAGGSVPLHPGVPEYADAEGRIIMWVTDNDQGRSLWMGVKLYGEVPYTYEVRYDDWAEVVTKIVGDVTIANADDPFAQLLNQEA